MLNSESISRLRSDVIERTINIEWIVNAIISQHYFRKVFLPFVLEFLYDEYCSFALKRRVLEKIIPDLEKRKLENLNRVNTIRNYFAHCNQVIVSGDPNDPTTTSTVVNPRKLDKAIDFEKLHSEFIEIAGPLEAYLGKVFQAKGGQMMKADEFIK